MRISSCLTFSWRPSWESWTYNYSQSCTRRYDLKSAKRFYEQPVQEPVQGCLWKTVATTCSNKVESSSCVKLPYPWSSLDVGYWIGCELGEYKLNTYSCALGVPPLRRMLWIYRFEIFWRWDLRTDIFAGTVRHGRHESMTTDQNYRMASHVAGEKKVPWLPWFWDVLRRAVESWTKAEPTRHHQAHKIPFVASWKLRLEVGSDFAERLACRLMMVDDLLLSLAYLTKWEEWAYHVPHVSSKASHGHGKQTTIRTCMYLYCTLQCLDRVGSCPTT